MWNFPIQPPQASSLAKEHDAIFFALSTLTAVFTLIVVIAVIIFAVRYRRGSKASRANPKYEDLRMELTWTIIPLLLGLVMFYFGARLYVRQRTPPPNSEEIFVIGKQWMWHVQHPNGVRENNTLHIPIGRPVKLTMISQDVIHAFYVPAFRTQMYVVPGRYTQMWFNATEPGQYHLFCNLYCGTQHSEMGGVVIAMPAREYAQWLANGGNSTPTLTMAQAGAKLYSKLACNNCHGIKDTPRAPSLVGIYGRKRTFTNAAPTVADEAYLRESILRPWERITSGYGQEMPTYEGQLTEAEVLDLVTYLKSMGATDAASTAAGLTTQAEIPARNTNTKNGLAVGAIRAQTQDPHATPTNHLNNPSVGAIAAQGQREGQNQ